MSGDIGEMRRDAGSDSQSTTADNEPALDIDAYRVVADCLTAMTLRLDVALAALDPGTDPALTELLLSLQHDAQRAISAFKLQPGASA